VARSLHPGRCRLPLRTIPADLLDPRAHILRRAFGRAELHDLFDTPTREPGEGA
jgi:hypothetical protein